MPVTKSAYIFITALKGAQRKGGADVKKRSYHGHFGKRRLLAVMLAMTMLLGMSTISVYADELTEEKPVEQVDVDVGELSETDAEADMGAGGEGAESESRAAPDTGAADTAIAEAESADTTAAPLVRNLRLSTAQKVVPEHHKYIRYNGDDNYTLTLDVKGAYASETTRPKVDVLLIVDQSGSMGEKISGQSKMKALQSVVSGTGGLTETILGTKSTLDARIAVVGYSGSKDREAYNDAWTVQTWTSDKATVDSSVNQMWANGGTNWEAGLRTGAEALAGCRGDAQKIVVFLSDGDPTYYYNASGFTAGAGSGYDGTAFSQAQAQLKKITGLNAFYTIGFGSAWGNGNSRMQTLLDSSSAAAKKYYAAADSAQLAKAFQEIAEKIEYTCRNVTITDVLSDYVELPDGEFRYTATATKGGVTEDITGKGIVQVQCSDKTVTAAFADGYVLDPDTVYAVNFDVKPSQKAYDEYTDQGGVYPHVGSAGSDAPGNTTSSGKNGFYSNVNENVTLEYTYGTDSATLDKDVYQEKPVVQVNKVKLPSLTIMKKVEGRLGDKTRSFEMKIRLTDRDGKPLTGNYGGLEFDVNGESKTALSDGQTVCLEKLPLGTKYQVTEVRADQDGYETTYEKCEGSLLRDQTATVTNRYKDEVPDTGISNGTSSAMGMMVALMLGAGMACMMASECRRKNKNGKETK